MASQEDLMVIGKKAVKDQATKQNGWKYTKSLTRLIRRYEGGDLQRCDRAHYVPIVSLNFLRHQY